MATSHCRELSRTFLIGLHYWLERDQGPLDALFHRAIRHTGIGLIHPHFGPSNPLPWALTAGRHSKMAATYRFLAATTGLLISV